MLRSFLLLLVLSLPILVCSQNSRLSRHMAMGSDTSEFYVKTYWHDFLTVLLHSTDNGQSLSIQSTVYDFGEGEGYPIYADSMPGVIYMDSGLNDSIWISTDFGITFTGKYFDDIWNPAAGCVAGEYYIQNPSVLFRSTDYGNSFTFDTIPNHLIELYDVGSLPGELFFRHFGIPDSIEIAVSHDYGATHNVVVLPIQNIYQWYDLRRGPGIGEFYFICWHQFKLAFDLFHSDDYGATLTFQGTSEDCGEMLTNCVAGRKPGVFYVSRRPVFNDSLFIDYSQDYGVTYTTYAYCLDSTFTSLSPNVANSQLLLFPNPAQDRITVDFRNNRDPQTVELLNLYGQLCAKVDIPHNCDQITVPTGTLPRGLYIFRVINSQGHVTAKKVLLN